MDTHMHPKPSSEYKGNEKWIICIQHPSKLSYIRIQTYEHLGSLALLDSGTNCLDK